MPKRELVTLREGADHAKLSDRTLRNYIARGILTGYRIGPRAIRIDMAELDALLRPIPSAEAS